MTLQQFTKTLSALPLSQFQSKWCKTNVPVKLSLQDSSSLWRALHDTSLVVWLWSSRQVVSCKRKRQLLQRDSWDWDNYAQWLTTDVIQCNDDNWCNAMYKAWILLFLFLWLPQNYSVLKRLSHLWQAVKKAGHIDHVHLDEDQLH